LPGGSTDSPLPTYSLAEATAAAIKHSGLSRKNLRSDTRQLHEFLFSRRVVKAGLCLPRSPIHLGYHSNHDIPANLNADCISPVSPCPLLPLLQSAAVVAFPRPVVGLCTFDPIPFPLPNRMYDITILACVSAQEAAEEVKYRPTLHYGKREVIPTTHTSRSMCSPRSLHRPRPCTVGDAPAK